MTQQPIARKSLGQHWLTDAAVLRAMSKAAEIHKEDVVLEIGPGLGSLTSILVKQASQVIAIEVDKTLARELIHRVVASNLIVIQYDILQFDLTTLPMNYKVVANIPYYLTSNLFRILCESSNPFKTAALLVQKEVAQRAVAQPGAMSLLSVSVQFYCKVSLGEIVSAKLFTPPPKVDSQILKLVYRNKPLFPDVVPKEYFKLVRAGFAQRRKTLLNSLSSGLQLDRETTLQLIKNAQIDPTTRAQTLSLNDWHQLYEAHRNLSPALVDNT